MDDLLLERLKVRELETTWEDYYFLPCTPGSWQISNFASNSYPPLVHCVTQPRGSPESFRTWLKPGAGWVQRRLGRKKKVAARGEVTWSYRDHFTWRCKPQIKSLAVDPL